MGKWRVFKDCSFPWQYPWLAYPPEDAPVNASLGMYTTHAEAIAYAHRAAKVVNAWVQANPKDTRTYPLPDLMLR